MEISISGMDPYCRRNGRHYRQLLRVMKLTALLLVVICMHVSANSYSQTITFSGKDVPLQAVFASIEKQTGLSFFFNYTIIKDVKPVTLDVRDVPLEDALNKVLKGQGLDYYRTGKTIFIVKKDMESPQSNVNDVPSPFLHLIHVKGRVTNKQGEPLAGATVLMKNGKRETLTDEKGMFELKNVPEDAILQISYLGYQKKEIGVNEKDILAIELDASNSQLDKVQVIAYGVTSQRLNTGNISMVSGEEIEKQPVDNPILALEGRVPGLFITQANGVAGGGVTIRIQGQNSIGNGNDPFYVIDGVPYSSQMLPTVGSNAGGILGSSGTLGDGAPAGTGNPLSYINPGDIESISVLKDADATAIYGSRAANGAILITTKKGKPGKTKIDLNLQEGAGDVTRFLKIMNLDQYLQMRHEALNNDGIAMPAQTDYDINGTWDSTRSTNWQKTMIGRTAQYLNLNGSVSGGTSQTQYLIGATYHRETTVFPGAFADQKGSMHFNINSASLNQKFHIQLIGSYMADVNHLPNSDLTSQAIFLAPDAPAVYKSNGTLNWQPDSTGTSTWANPFANLYNDYQNTTRNLIANSILSYTIFPGLEIKSNFGYNNLQTNEFSGIPLIYFNPETQNALGTSGRFGYFSNSTLNSWIVEPQADYKVSFSEGKADILVGSTIQQTDGNGTSYTGRGYNSDALLSDIFSAAAVSINATTNSIYKYNALFGRVNYNWANKYISDFTLRRDGSSRFGSDNQFHNFWSEGIAWIFSEENFIQKRLKFLSFGKIRGSYGTTGNDQIGNYQYLNLYSSTFSPVPYQGVTGLQVSGAANPNLQWEETRKAQFGIDLGFLHDYILVNATFAHNRSSNELLGYQLPGITGLSSITENFPATVQNNAWEFTINSINIRSKSFEWHSSLNFTIPENKLVSFPGLATSTYAAQLIVGQPLNIQKYFHFLGVNPATGVYQFASKTGPTASPTFNTDNNVLVSTLPKFYGGLQNTVIYKAVQLDLLFSFVEQIGSNISQFGNGEPGHALSNQPVSVLSRWQYPGQVTNIQRYNSDGSIYLPYLYAANFSDASWSKAASYIRLKNIALSVAMPGTWKHKVGLDECRVFVNAQNLLTITKFKGLDPENQSTQSIPPLRMITAGLKLAL